MARKSRLRTKANKSQRLKMVLAVLFTLGLIGWVGFAYRHHLQTLADVWRETAPVAEASKNTVRGTIYDRNFKELAYTMERVSLYARPREITDLSGTVKTLSELLGISEAKCLTSLSQDSHMVWLLRDLDQEDEEKIRKAALPGIYQYREQVRTYPGKTVGAHIVGYSENDVGLAGIEHYYNTPLTHSSVRQADLPQVDFGGDGPTNGDGHDLVLTVDLKIEKVLDQYIAKLGKSMEGAQIAAVLMETETGKIIGGANYPSYNPNGIWQYEKEVLENLLFTPMVVPDDLRTVFLEASLLQGVWEQSTQVYPWSIISGNVSYPRQLRLWERLQLTTPGHVDVTAGERQNMSVPEFTGCLPTRDVGTVPRVLSPFKVMLGFTHLVNGGKRIQPHFLDRILVRPSQKEYLYNAFRDTDDGMSVLPAMVSEELQKSLQLSGVRGLLGSVSISGQTVSCMKGKKGEQEYVRDRMSLTLIPAEKPELILLLAARQKLLGPQLADDSAAGYLSADIDSVLPSMVALQQVHANFSGLLEAEERKDVNFQTGKKSRVDRGKTLAGMLDEEIHLMPDLTGMSLRQGLRLLDKSDLKIRVEGSGRIVAQKPKVGKLLEKGGQCLLVLKKDTAPQNVIPVQHM